MCCDDKRNVIKFTFIEEGTMKGRFKGDCCFGKFNFVGTKEMWGKCVVKWKGGYYALNDAAYERESVSRWGGSGAWGYGEDSPREDNSDTASSNAPEKPTPSRRQASLDAPSSEATSSSSEDEDSPELEPDETELPRAFSSSTKRKADATFSSAKSKKSKVTETIPRAKVRYSRCPHA